MHPKSLLLLLLLLSPTVAHAADPTLRVAVLDFTNAAPDPQWDALGKGLQSMVTTDLSELASGRDDLQVIERARLVDLQTEMKLGASGQVDAKTAAKLGKLAGASHLVAGSFTVVGTKMRLDARMIDVSSGSVAMTAAVEGDKDAFFELEKDLVKRLVDSVGVKTTPKERAKLGEVHTADLEAFRAYSEGIAQFDAKQYDLALKNLEKAARLDDGFDLAKRTLAQYEQLANDARGHADAAAVAEAEAAKRAAAQAAGWDALMLDRITKIQDTTKDPLDRAIATSLLIEIFDASANMNGKFADLRQKNDAFVLERLSDRYAQKYAQDVRTLMPKIWPYPYQTVWGVYGFPDDAHKQFDAWWKQLRTVAARPHDTLGFHHNDGVYFARRMHLDESEELDLVERGLRAIDKQLEPERKVQLRRSLAEDMLKMGLTDRAAKVLTEIRQFTSDADALKEVADWLEMGRDVHAELARSDALAPWRREFFALNYTWPPTSTLRDARKLFVGDTLSDDAIRQLVRYRRWSARDAGEDYHWVGDTLVWPLLMQRGEVGSASFSTDRLRAPGLRWFYGAKKPQPDAAFLAALGEGSMQSLAIALTLDFTRAADWTDSHAADIAPSVHPAVTVLFAMRDILGPSQGDAHPPLVADGVRFEGGKATLVHVTRDKKNGVTVEARDSKSLALGDKKNDVKVEVRGATVTVSVGSKSARFDLPGDREGYPGILIEGPGYVEVSAMKVAP